VYPDLPPYGSENRPTLTGNWQVPMNLNDTSLTGNGTFQFNAPGNIYNDFFIDSTLNIEVWAVNYSDPELTKYSFNVLGNITVSADGRLNAIANIFTQKDINYHIHNFGVFETHFVVTNLTHVIHPQGITIVDEYFHVLNSLFGFNNTLQIFGKLSIKGKMRSDVTIVLHKDAQIILEEGSSLTVSENAFIEDCGGIIQNNGGVLKASVESCSSLYSYSHYIHEVEKVILKKENIARRLAHYDL
jgi:hypothetical protein